MEQRDLVLIQRYMDADKTLESLYHEHLEFERQLEKFNSKPWLTPLEEMERKKLQKMKLKGRDGIETILRDYRKQESPS